MTARHVLPVLLLAAGAVCGAPPGQALAAAKGATMAAPLPANALPVPPPPPPQLQAMQEFAPAPVPDPDLQRPLADVMADRPRTKVVPNLFKPTERVHGDGYVTGSAGTYDGDTRLRPNPVLNLLVPLK